MRCDGCGAESPLKPLFVCQRRSFRRGHQTLCPGCVRRRTETTYRTLFVLWLLAGLASAVSAEGQGVRWPTNLLLLAIFEYLSIVPHELAHATASWLTRMEVFRITFGVGRRWLHLRVGGTLIEAGALPVCGAVYSFSLNQGAWRLRRLAVVAAGPVANAAICVGAVWAGGGWPRIVQVDWSEHLAPWLMLAIANGLLVLGSLLRRRAGIQRFPSDGVQLFRLLFRRLPVPSERRLMYFRAKVESLLFARAYGQLDALIARFRDELSASELTRWQSLADAELGRFDAARAGSLTLLESCKDPSVERAFWLNVIAWNDLVVGASELLAEAEAFSADAFSLRPWDAAVQSTRGWALVEAGKLAAGIPLLRQSLHGAVYKHDRASIMCTLAIAECRRGRRGRAAQLLRRANRLDPHCILLARAESEANELAAAA
jgi:hypothetical protein